MTKQAKPTETQAAGAKAAETKAAETKAAETDDSRPDEALAVDAKAPADESLGWTEAADQQVASFSAFQGPILEATSHAFERYVEGVAEMNQEMTRFVAERLRYDAEFGHALAGCRSFAQAAEMQQEWVRRAAEDYMTEAKKLGEIGQKVVAETTHVPSSL